MAQIADQEVANRNYQQLLGLDDDLVVTNSEDFVCPICFDDVEVGDGIVLRECLHVFCRECLVSHVNNATSAEITCPFNDNDYSCQATVTEREMRGICPDDVFERHLALSMTQAESKAANSFHCRTADCAGWCIVEDEVNFFNCPVCMKENCLTCAAIHDGQSCKQYQDDIKRRAAQDVDAAATQLELERMLQHNEALKCPHCGIVISKKAGCDWLQCTMCKTEICWVTRGPRWGPSGVGDVSAGCRCNVNNVRCHPQCGNCH